MLCDEVRDWSRGLLVPFSGPLKHAADSAGFHMAALGFWNSMPAPVALVESQDCGDAPALPGLRGVPTRRPPSGARCQPQAAPTSRGSPFRSWAALLVNRLFLIWRDAVLLLLLLPQLPL